MVHRCQAVLVAAALSCLTSAGLGGCRKSPNPITSQASGPADAGPASGEPTIPVRGLKEPVELIVDRFGVPHAFAKNQPDVFFAQGFAAARDRLFQMDFWRRRGLGLLSEVLGPDYVEQDRAARLFLYRQDIDREWRSYGSSGTAEAKDIAASFVAGINAYVDFVASHPDMLPWEFKELCYAPARWAPEDIVRIRSHALSRNLRSEVARANTACKLNLETDSFRLRALEPPQPTVLPKGLDPCLPPDLLNDFALATKDVKLNRRPPGCNPKPLTGQIELPGDDSDSVEGSNNWVIEPSRSATRRAILANDPHRDYSVPSLRYVTHLSAPGLDVIGGGEPALPGISIGHNGTIAFGLTIFAIDQEDLYVYELNDHDEYRYGNGWEPLQKYGEDILVKRDDGTVGKEKRELLFTRHGPVIAIEPAKPHAKRRAFAVRTVWSEPGTAAYFGSIDYMRARDFAAFRKSLHNWGAPSLNFVYADIAGNIGWVAAGRAPKRSAGDGLLPVPGDGRYEWNGFWSGAELPFAEGSSEGHLATANQMNIPWDYPRKERQLGFEWANPSRYERILEVLRSHRELSLEDSMSLQNDATSIPARRLVALLAAMSSPGSEAQKALELLRGWDAVERADSPQAALFEVWIAHHLGPAFLNAVVRVKPKGGEKVTDVIKEPDVELMIDTLESPVPLLGKAPTAATARDKLLWTSLASAYAELEKLQGPDAHSWQWGRLHHNHLEHKLSSIVSAQDRARIDVGPLEVGSSPYAPNQSTYQASDFRHTKGASLRVVLDVGNWDDSRFLNYPGQSGDPANAHYRDHTEAWLQGRYFPLLYSRQAIEAAAEKRFMLVPVQ